MSILSKHKPTN